MSLARTFDQDDWDPHKESFEVSESELTDIFRTWNLKKSYLSRGDAEFIHSEIQKRAAEGKKTRAEVGDSIFQQDQIERRVKRQHTTVLEQHRKRLKASEGESKAIAALQVDRSHINLVTPTPSHSLASATPERSGIAHSLSPPLEGVARLSLTRSISPAITTSTTRISPDTRELLNDCVFRDEYLNNAPSTRFEYIFENQINPRFKVQPSSALDFNTKNPKYNVILCSKPITNPKKWVSKISAGILKEPTPLPDVLSFFKMLMMRLSNNIDDRLIQSQYMDMLMYSGFFQNHIQILEEILKIERLKFTKHSFGTDISFNSPDYTAGFCVVARNFSCELLYTAARSGNMKILEMLLDIGILHYKYEKYNFNKEIGATAIQFAIEHRQEAVIQRLFRERIDVEARPISNLSPSLLWTAVIFDRPDLVTDLIKLGASDTPKTFEKSHLSLQYEKYLKGLDLHWEKRIGSRLDDLKVTTALQLSVTGSRYDCFRILADEHTLRRRFSCSRGRIGILHLALVENDYRMMEDILARPEFANHIDQSIGTEINGRYYLYTALALAIYNLDGPGTGLLVARGADIMCVHLDPFRDGFDERISNILSRTPPLLPYCFYFDYLQKEGLDDILERLYGLQCMAEEEPSLDELIADSSDDDSDTEFEVEDVMEISQFGRELLPNIFAVMQDLFKDNEQIEDRLRATFLHLTFTFFQKLEIRIQKDTRREPGKPGFIRVLFKGHPYGDYKIKAYLELISKTFKLLKSHPLYGPFVDVDNICFFSLCLPRKSKARAQKILRKFVSVQRFQADSRAKDKLTAFCFKNSDTVPRGSATDTEYNKNKGSKLLRNLERSMETTFHDFPLIFEWSLCVPDQSFHRKLCDRFVSLLPDMADYRIEPFLRVAIRYDLFDIAEAILESHPDLRFPGHIISEAAWFAGPKLFRLVLGRQALDAGGEQLQFALLISIMLAQYYKVVQLLQILPKSELGFDFGFKTSALNIAIMMGRTDIVAALLQAGAPQDRDSNKTLAYDEGHLALINMMEYVTNKKELDENSIERSKDGGKIDLPQIENDDQDVLAPCPASTDLRVLSVSLLFGQRGWS